jgi:hypothetical protein
VDKSQSNYSKIQFFAISISKSFSELGSTKISGFIFSRYSFPVLSISKDVAKADIVLVATNKMRDIYNKKLLELNNLSTTEILPIGSKVILRRNKWDTELYDSNLDLSINPVNGLIGFVVSKGKIDKKNNTLKISVKPEFSEVVFNDIIVDLNKWNNKSFVRTSEANKEYQCGKRAFR